MAAVILHRITSFASQASSWKNLVLKPSTSSVLLIRDYRGSNRDTRRRKRNQMLQINRELEERGLLPKRQPFDRQKFMLKHFPQESYSLLHRLGVSLKDPSMLLKVFNCSSPLLGSTDTNEKLALHGYFIASTFTTSYLLRRYPLLPVNLLEIFRSKILSRSHVAAVANHLSLSDFIFVEPDLPKLASEKHLPFVKDDLVCDCFYALIAAIYDSMGQESVDSFIHDFLLKPMDLSALLTGTDVPKPKQALDGICELANIAPPRARVIHKLAETSSLPVYVIGVFSGKWQIGESGGPTVAAAKEAAYLDSILRLLSYDGQEFDPVEQSECLVDPL